MRAGHTVRLGWLVSAGIFGAWLAGATATASDSGGAIAAYPATDAANRGVAASTATTAPAQPAASQPGRPGRPGRPGARLPGGADAYLDVEFARIGQNGRSLKLDLYIPQHAKGQGSKLPVIVWVHGGAWQAGNKNATPAVAFLKDGFAVASISYRLSQEAIFPAQIHDCKAAVRWLRANAEKYDLDKDRFGAWGASAGGHLVALLGTSGGVKDLEGDVGGNLDQSSRVQAVCDFFGPTNFLAMIGRKSTMDHASDKSPESLLIGGAVERFPERVKAADPITYVGKDDPPFLIVHGDADPLVPLNQSELLHEALKKAGVESTLHIVKGGGHGGFRDPKVNELVAQFFGKHLKTK